MATDTHAQLQRDLNVNICISYEFIIPQTRSLNDPP